MQAKELREILQELTGLAEHVNQADVDKLIAEIEGANKLFLAGAGRSGFMIRAFANRLMHLGYETYLVGETITPPAKEGDLLIIGSGSGETGSLVSMAQKAVAQKAKIALIPSMMTQAFANWPAPSSNCLARPVKVVKGRGSQLSSLWGRRLNSYCS
ncbi:SIS domain-containing protein [Klebsiella pneumoniae]